MILLPLRIVTLSQDGQSLASDVESLGVDANKEDCCTFLAEQLRLMCTAAKDRRYSINIIIYSFTIFDKSYACYGELRKTLCLPSRELLRDISSLCVLILGMYVKIILKAGQLWSQQITTIFIE